MILSQLPFSLHTVRLLNTTIGATGDAEFIVKTKAKRTTLRYQGGVYDDRQFTSYPSMQLQEECWVYTWLENSVEHTGDLLLCSGGKSRDVMSSVEQLIPIVGLLTMERFDLTSSQLRHLCQLVVSKGNRTTERHLFDFLAEKLVDIHVYFTKKDDRTETTNAFGTDFKVTHSARHKGIISAVPDARPEVAVKLTIKPSRIDQMARTDKDNRFTRLLPRIWVFTNIGRNVISNKYFLRLF